MIWLAGGALVVVMAIVAFSWWVIRKGDTLHVELRETALTAAAARTEVLALGAQLTETAASFADERRRRIEETGALDAALTETRARLAAVDTQAGIVAGLTR